MFRRKPKTTFDQLPQEAQKLILRFNTEWNMQDIAEGWAIVCWEKNKSLYHREGGTQLYMLHLMKQMIDEKVAFHKPVYEQIKWFKKTWVNYGPLRQGHFTLPDMVQFPQYLLPLMSKWISTLIQEKGFYPDWGPLEPSGIYPNSLQDSGLFGKLVNELREHPLLYLLWASMWYGKTTEAEYTNVLILLNQFIYLVASKFQNPELAASVLEELIVQDIDILKPGFLEHVKTCY